MPWNPLGPPPPTAASFISADADNQIAQGTDNLLFVPAAAPPSLTAGNGIGIAADVISAALSADAGNILVFGTDNGLFVPAPAPPDPASLISADAGNLVVQGTDNLLYVSDDIGIGSLTQSGSVTLAGTGAASSPLSATVVYSSDSGNIAAAGSDNGVFVPAPTPPSAATFISADADNQLVQGSDDLLFVAASGGGLTAVATTNSDNITFAGDGTAGTPLSANINVNTATGSTGTVLLAGDGTAGNAITANVVMGNLVSADANNQVSVAASDNRLFVPEVSASSLISSDAGNVLLAGTDSLLLVPPGVFNMAGGEADLQSNYTLSGTDSGGLLRASAQGIDITVPEPANFVDGFIVGILNVAAEAVTVTPASNVDILASTPGTATSNVGATITMQTGAFLWLRKPNNSIWDAWGNGISWT